MKKYLLVILPLLALVLMLVVYDMIDAYQTAHMRIPVPGITRFWEYQCVDTMKSSRDMAREQLGNIARAKIDIEKEVKLVADLGANCIAIATPYDEEFLPVLTLWVEYARNYGLRVWFRGNFSGWEGWFDYPKDISLQRHLQVTKDFILNHRQLFKSGDIFTGAPEAENGGPFAGNNNPSIFPAYREFLVAQHLIAEDAFNQIDVDVSTNWFSMNGWIAKNMYTKDTLDEIGNAVTIDHYTKDLEGMEEYIRYFKETYNATVNLGEFGAPIPDLNGNMSEEEQSRYVSDLMKLFYRYRDTVRGVNYWTLRFGTTHLVNDDFSTRKVYDTVKRYYSPGVVYGRVLNTIGKPLKNVRVHVSTYDTTAVTDSRGYYFVVLPAGPAVITYTAPDASIRKEEIHLLSGERKEFSTRIIPAQAGPITKIRDWYRGFMWRLP